MNLRPCKSIPGPESYAQIPELAERGRRRVLHFFYRLNDQLAGNEFLAGDNYSIAEVSKRPSAAA